MWDLSVNPALVRDRPDAPEIAEKIAQALGMSQEEVLKRITSSNGFEYINMIIDDYKMGNYLTDKQLKMIGINIPGDRAKILIRFEEKANFYYHSVYLIHLILL